MDPFTIKIAGLVACVQPKYLSTREYCRFYLSDLEPECVINVSEDDFIYEQEMAEREALDEGIRVRKYSNPYLERATIQRKIALELMNRNTIMLHGSTVAVDGNAYLFTAPCGTGKSTHTRFWREIFGGRAVMVNDDKPFLQVTPSGVLAYGSPWSGKHGLDSNVCFPLKGICILRRGMKNEIWRVDPSDHIAMLRHQCFVPEDPVRQMKVYTLLDALLQNVPLWGMTCTKDPEAALVSYHAMSGSD